MKKGCVVAVCLGGLFLYMMLSGCCFAKPDIECGSITEVEAEPSVNLSIDSKQQVLMTLEAEELEKNTEVTPVVAEVAPVVETREMITAIMPTADELYWLERLVEAEAGNQSMEGRRMVCDLVLNRVASEEFYDDILNVIFEEDENGYCQFSPVGNGYLYQVTPSEETIEAVKLSLSGDRILPEGVLFFCKTDCMTGWFYTREVWGTEGDHTFCY